APQRGRELRHLLDGQPDEEATAPAVALLAPRPLRAHAIERARQRQRPLLLAVERHEPVIDPRAIAGRRRHPRVLVIAARRPTLDIMRLGQGLGAGTLVLAHGDDVVARLAPNLEHATTDTLVRDRIAGVALVAGKFHRATSSSSGRDRAD